MTTRPCALDHFPLPHGPNIQRWPQEDAVACGVLGGTVAARGGGGMDAGGTV
jgi:hypothetical protein